MQLVKGRKNTAENPERRKFLSGEVVPKSGIYKVTHTQHRLPHEVTVLSGQTADYIASLTSRSLRTPITQTT